MERELVLIDEEKCNGCGACVPNCHEGALQIIDGKAVLISDLMCDGLGACLSHCPEGALTIEKMVAQPYDETEVIKRMAPKGKNVVLAHLLHLRDHKEFGFMKEGMRYLRENRENINFNLDEIIAVMHGEVNSSGPKHAENIQDGHQGCPGSRSVSFEQPAPLVKAAFSTAAVTAADSQASQLTHWPVQLHLIQPAAAHFQHADLLVAADCVAFSMANFHANYLQGKKLVIACPKLDSNKEIYHEKFIHLVNVAQVNTITVMIMEVPCCGGMLQMVQMAVAQANRRVPVKAIKVSIKGLVLSEEWV
jgi:NAD-dependent dihydropyrimidine dehydrogenase PreA subunit